MAISVLCLLIFLPFLAANALDLWDSKSDLCIIVIPCVILYSRINSDYGLYYISTFLGFLLIIFISVMYKWMSFDQIMKKDDLKEINKNNLSKMFFNAWDWTIHTNYELNETRRV